MCWVARALVSFGMFGLVLSISVDVAAKLTPKSSVQMQLSFAPLVKRAAPAVVNIYTRRVVERVLRSPLFDDPFFRRFFGERFGSPGRKQQQKQNSLGSGVILTADGMIVTNHHVIRGADEITVALSDRREFDATLVLDDERTDLAVLSIDTDGERLPFLELRDSDSLEVGDLVLAIGNPFNVGQTVTSGIVSALARTGIGVSDFQFFIQTDAAINPGNSGGALISVDGRLVGINSAIYSKTGGSHGIGFAVPSAMVRAVLSSAKAGLSHVKRPWLGASTQVVTADIAVSIGMKRPRGVIVRSVFLDGPADQAGVVIGDVVLAVDGHDISSPTALNFRLGTRMIGENAPFTILRNGNLKKFILRLVAAPEKPERNLTKLIGRQPFANATVANLSPALAEELGLDTLSSGVIVMKVDERTPARRYLRPGDKIIKVNRDSIALVKDLVRSLRKSVDEWQITMQRGNKIRTIRFGL